MSLKLSIEEQIRLERQHNLARQAEKEEIEDLILNQLLELDFRQSLVEMGVNINEFNL